MRVKARINRSETLWTTFGSAGSRVAFVCLAAAFLSGCALSPRLGPPPLAGPPTDLMRSAEPDTLVAPASTPTEASTPTASSTRTRAPRATLPKTRTATDSTAAATSGGQPDSVSIAPAEATLPRPALSIDLPESERARLETKALQDLEACESIVSRLGGRNLTTESDEKLRTVRGLLLQAHSALRRRDLSAAANLAHKAKLLAMEIQPHGS